MAAITPTKISIKEANDHLQQLYQNLSEMQSEVKKSKALLEEEKANRQAERIVFENEIAMLKSSVKSEEDKVECQRVQNGKLNEEIEQSKQQIDTLLLEQKQQVESLQRELNEKSNIIKDLQPKVDLLIEIVRCKGSVEHLLGMMHIATREFGLAAEPSSLLDMVEPTTLQNNADSSKHLSGQFSIGDQDSSNEEDVY